MEINYPIEKTYFIAYNENDDNVHYGTINTDQCMVTGKQNVFSTTVEQEYIDELLKYGIKYEDTLPVTGSTFSTELPTELQLNLE
jgi:hypothetical protein